MASSFLNRAKMSVSGTPGTGTITLNAAVSQFLSFAEAGAVNATQYSYVIEEGNDFEIGVGTYTSSGTTFSRDSVTASKIGGTAGTSKMNLTSAATITITLRKEDLATLSVAASQSEMEAGSITDKFVSPGRQQYHPSAAKVWCAWGVTSTIDASYNVSSVTDNGTGDWTVNFSVSFSSADYNIQYTTRLATSSLVGSLVGASQANAPTVSAVRLKAFSTDGYAGDPTKNYVACFGDQ